jgi:heme o synthase
VLWPVAHLNLAYLRSVAGLGGIFLYEAYQMRSRVLSGVDARPMRLFQWSITYLSMLFLAVAVTAVWYFGPSLNRRGRAAGRAGRLRADW